MSCQCSTLNKGAQLIPGYGSDEDSVLRERVWFTRVARRTASLEKL